MKREGNPASHLMDHLDGQSISLNPGQALVAATLNAVLTLTYEKVTFVVEMY